VVYECDVNMQDRHGRTATHRACMNGHLDTVKVLLSVFADVNTTDDDGYTPIHGNVNAVRKWLHGDGRYNVKKQ
jgi:ankyrin repeat protein